MDKIEQFAQLIQKQQFDRLNTDMPKPEFPDFWLADSKTTIKQGKKYTKVDLGRSGKFMIVNETGAIHGIKAYGVIHPKKQFGTLDTIHQYYWGDYNPRMLESLSVSE